MVCDEAMRVNMYRCLANAARGDDRGIIVAMLRSIASAGILFRHSVLIKNGSSHGQKQALCCR